MPRKKIIQEHGELSQRQRNILFSVVKEYCDTGEIVGSKELKEKYFFSFSSATIRNELVILRDLGYLFQPFTNSGSKPTEKAYKLFVTQLMIGLQVTSKQQQDLKKQLGEMELKHSKLTKEITKLLAFQGGGVGFALTRDHENYAGVKNLLDSPHDGKVSEILEFLDNLEDYKPYLLEGGNEGDKKQSQQLQTIIGTENPILPLGKGYAMVTTEVYLDSGEKSVVGLITPVHLLAKKKNLELMQAINKVLGKKGEE